ncbi:MAG: EAL domain-containing protein [Eubacterium sp.]
MEREGTSAIEFFKEYGNRLPGGYLLYRARGDEEILYANDELIRMFDCHSEEEFFHLTNKSFKGIVSPEEYEEAEETIWTQINSNHYHLDTLSYHINTAEGRRKEIDDFGYYINDPELGEIFSVFLIEAGFRRLASDYDGLTGLMGMRSFLSQNERSREDHIRQNRMLDRWIVFMNISQFKLYNVTYGIEAGDRVLKGVAYILRDVFQTDNIARFADDHFVVCSTSDDVVKRLDEVFQRVLGLDSRFVLRMKAGIYHVTDSRVQVSAACDFAKLACDSIAEDAARFICEYDGSRAEELKLRKYIVDHIEETIEKGWIEVVYQPMVRSLTGAVCGSEALSRWHDPRYGDISPAVFIPVLEQAHVIHLLDSYVAQQACESIREVMDNGDEPMPISINLSRLDFTDTDPVQVVETYVARYDIARDYLCIEITETALMRETVVIRSAMERFQALGYQVWMDDFGSGYSSHNTLKDFNFDEIKIDMMFLTSFTEKSRTILKSIVAMAKSMKILTLAEGVETREQFEFLKQIGCEKVQGYYFGKPMNRVDFRENIDRRGLSVEPRSMRKYYTAVGHVNLMSDRPVALLEHEQGRFYPVFENEPFRRVMYQVGSGSLEESYRRLNDVRSVLHKTYERFIKKVEAQDETMVLMYPDRDKMMRLEAEKIAQFGNRYMLQLSVSYEEEREISKRQKKLDSYLRALSLIYDGAVAIHIKDNYIERILMDGSFESFEKQYQGVRQSFRLFAENFVAGEDRERYLAFTDMTTLAERIQSGGLGYLTGTFSVYDPKSERYLNKEMMTFLAPNTDGNLAFGIMRTVEDPGRL